jgi:hypothetical protein
MLDSCDTYGAMKVFMSGAKVSVINHVVTSKNWWERDETAKLLECSNDNNTGEMRVVGLLMEEWFTYRSGIFYTTIRGTCPHDPLTTLEGIYPGKYINYIRGHIMIHEWAGFCSFVYDPLGPHRMANNLITEESSKKFLDDFSEYIISPIKQLDNEE